jgi:hypothetical protein
MDVPHAQAIISVKDWLNRGKSLTISDTCPPCRMTWTRTIKIDQDTEVCRSQGSVDGSFDYLAIVNISGGDPRLIIEIMHHTCRTGKVNRPIGIDWYELYAEDILEENELGFWSPSLESKVIKRGESPKCSECVIREKEAFKEEMKRMFHENELRNARIDAQRAEKSNSESNKKIKIN